MTTQQTDKNHRYIMTSILTYEQALISLLLQEDRLECTVIKSAFVNDCLVAVVQIAQRDTSMVCFIAPIAIVRERSVALDFALPEECGRDSASAWGMFHESEEHNGTAYGIASINEGFATLLRDAAE